MLVPKRSAIYQLFYPRDELITDETPSVVLLQQDFSSCYGGYPTSATNGRSPYGIASDDAGNLYVVDHGNNRLLMYVGGARNPANGSAASYVYGQPAPTTFNPGNALDQLSSPIDIYYDSTRTLLWVADYGNNRVLGFSIYVSRPSPMQRLQLTFLGQTPQVIVVPKGKLLSSSLSFVCVLLSSRRGCIAYSADLT